MGTWASRCSHEAGHRRIPDEPYRGDDDVQARIARAEPANLRPLEMVALTESGTSTGSLAYNDVSLLRQTPQAAHIGIDLNGQERVAELIVTACWWPPRRAAPPTTIPRMARYCRWARTPSR